MIMKLLLLGGVIAVVYFLFFKKKTQPEPTSKNDAGSAKEEGETMVPCEECGVYTSVKEAYLKEGRYYCSKTCLKKH